MEIAQRAKVFSRTSRMNGWSRNRVRVGGIKVSGIVASVQQSREAFQCDEDELDRLIARLRSSVSP
jgi:hypothetical protein